MGARFNFNKNSIVGESAASKKDNNFLFIADSDGRSQMIYYTCCNRIYLLIRLLQTSSLF